MLLPSVRCMPEINKGTCARIESSINDFLAGRCDECGENRMPAC